jgi:beta-lactamase superfamily II metal-dependent hydrolase
MRTLPRAGAQLAFTILALGFVGCRAAPPPEPRTDSFPVAAKTDGSEQAIAAQAAEPDREPSKGKQSFTASPKAKPGGGDSDGRRFGPHVEPAPATASLDDELEIHFIEVGQGDATLLQLPNGTSILVDGGSLKDRDPKALKDYLEAELDDDTIDMLVITHGDADHYNLLPYAVSGITVEHVLYVGAMTDHKATANVTNASSKKYQGFYKWLSNRDTDTRTKLTKSDIDAQDSPSNTLFSSGDVDIYIVAADIRDGTDKNTKSIVLLVSYGDFDCLLTGDATFKTEEAIVDKYDDWWLDVECLKLGHHGSKWTSTSQSWVDVVLPEVAVASASLTKKHGHPSEGIRSRLEEKTQAAAAHKIKWWSNSSSGTMHSDYAEAIYSTATNGTIVVTTNGSSFDVDYTSN